MLVFTTLLQFKKFITAVAGLHHSVICLNFNTVAGLRHSVRVTVLSVSTERPCQTHHGYTLLLQDLPADDEAPSPEDARNAITSMRTAELELRSRLRFLQVARVEGWEVATQFLKVTDGTTEDPAVVEARKVVAKNKKEREDENNSTKSRKASQGQSPRPAKQWARGGPPQQAPAYAQHTGYGFAGANAYSNPLFYNFANPQQYYGQPGAPSQWPTAPSQTPIPLPPAMTTVSTASYRQASQPPTPLATPSVRAPPICFSCQLPGHIRKNCPDNNKPNM